MRRAAVLVALCSLVTLAPSARVSGAEPTPTTVSCGQEITESIIVQNDLGDCAGNGLVAMADNISIDLGGNTLDGNGAGLGDGVLVNGHKGVDVTNGVIKEFRVGVNLGSSPKSTVSGVTVSNTTDHGINVAGSPKAKILSSFVSHAAEFGIVIGAASNRARIEGTKTFGNNIGIRVSNSARVTVAESESSYNTAQGVIVGVSAQKTKVRDNILSANGAAGLLVHPNAVGTKVSGNVAERNGGNGILSDTADVKVKQNAANLNDAAGIFVPDGAKDEQGNKASGNEMDPQCSGVECPEVPVATNVSCGQFVTTDVTLNGDLRDCPDSGLVIGANGVTVDLGGFTIDGNDNGPDITADNGITIGFRSNVTIRNGTIRNFGGNGIFAFSSAADLVIEDVVVDRNVYANIQFSNVHDSLIQRVTLSRAFEGSGLDLRDNAASNTIMDSSIEANRWGVSISTANINAVTTNDVYYNVEGVAVGNFTGNGNANHVVGNSVFGSGVHNITVDAQNTDVSANTTFLSLGNGIDVAPGDDGATLADNGAGYNRLYGISAQPTTTDGGGNQAVGNLDPTGPQCVNVAC